MKEIENRIEAIRLRFAPDKRTNWFWVTVDHSNQSIEGEVDEIQAFEAIEKEVCQVFHFQNFITLLPKTEANHANEMLAANKFINIRQEPNHRSELLTQSLFGQTLKILKQEHNWFLVKNEDPYLGWVEAKEVCSKPSGWNTENKLVFFNKISGIVQGIEGRNIEVQWQTKARLIENKNVECVLQLADGQEIIGKSEDWSANFSPSNRLEIQEKLYANALALLDVPYLWGGKSVVALDCSGFTKLLFDAVGINLPRDASQQVFFGSNIPEFKTNLENLDIGDLLFFAEAGRSVSHVAMYLSEGKYIHASGKVCINSMISGDEKFDSFRFETMTQAKRLIPFLNEKKFTN